MTPAQLLSVHHEHGRYARPRPRLQRVGHDDCSVLRLLTMIYTEAFHFFAHLLDGVMVKGRVLMMPLADDQRDVPEVHGVSEVARPIAARPTP